MTTMAKMIVIFVALMGIYLAFLWNDMRKVDQFCHSIAISSNVSDLPLLAQRADVKLYGPLHDSNQAGTEVLAWAVSPMTLGDYHCNVTGTSMTGTVMRKHLGEDSGEN